MNSLVVFEAILAASCLISVNLTRQAFFPASLFWAFGAASFAIMAIFGTLKFAGIGGFEAYHASLRSFSNSIGLVAFAFGALFGLFANTVSRFYWPVLLIGILGLSGTLLFGDWKMPLEYQEIIVGVMFLIGIVRLISSGMVALYLIIGAICMMASKVLVQFLAVKTGFDAMNIHNILLALSILSFGVAASRDDWE
ncbi:MAG: hypothetical protein EP348_01085 [Alphaproteobacteria bacterium]|nr:MAG: hypothetical protein EP348_01085 [Alphaproteobacteria bacterium]